MSRRIGTAAPGTIRAVPPALVMRGVWKTFSAGTQECAASARVLAGVSLAVATGEVVGIGGAAGAGKSTLLRCAAGLLTPERGSVSFGVGCGIVSPGQRRHPEAAPPGRRNASSVESSGRIASAPPLYLDLRAASARRELERALAAGFRLILADHVARRELDQIREAIERLLGDRYPTPRSVERGAVSGGKRLPGPHPSIILAGRSCAELARVASRVVKLRDGRLHAHTRPDVGAAPWMEVQRKRSAARANSEFPAAFARASIRSTSARSLRSPQ